MRVKRYVVETMPEAMKRIRSELGKDAVILNTKDVKTGGFLGFFGKKMIEVIAAIDTANTSSDAGVASSVKSPAVFKSSNAAAAAYASNHVNSSNLSNSSNASNGSKTSNNTASPSLSKAVVPDESEMDELQPLISHPIISVATVNRTASAKDEQIMGEIRQMKDMVLRLSRGDTASFHVPPEIENMKRVLLEQEIMPSLVNAITDEVLEQLKINNLECTDDHVLQKTKKVLQARISANGFQGMSLDTRVAHFVGPTGVGKTTTIAKLAAEQVLKHNRKVGFITSDTYRIAAIEQLKTYATILNIPIEVVFSHQELNKAFEQLKDRDIIFMDTAGRNFRNQMYVSELNSLIKSKGQSETYLVLSLTMKYKDMKEITDNFAKFKLDKVLFTKMDETSSYGSIINLLHDFQIKLSYLTHGQNVPDDISIANEKQIVNDIVGGDKV